MGRTKEGRDPAKINEKGSRVSGVKGSFFE
jgi:hypothetical protein